MEDITDADYVHAKRVCKVFEIKNSVEYHDLYVQCNTLWLADVFEDFQNMFDELDPAKTFSAHGLAWQAALTLIWVGFLGVRFEVGGGGANYPLSKFR